MPRCLYNCPPDLGPSAFQWEMMGEVAFEAGSGLSRVATSVALGGGRGGGSLKDVLARYRIGE